MLSRLQVLNVCMFGGGNKCCRYLVEDELDSSKFHCNKLRPLEKANIDKEVSGFILDCKRKKTNPSNYSKPIGDNCDGFLILRNIEQGYDIS